MMKITPPVKVYTDYLKKTFTWLNRLAADEHLSRVWVYFDYFSALLRHRCLIRQYVIGQFWRLSNPERRKRLTYGRIVRLFDRYNQPDYIHFLNEKAHFNAFFSDFVHRDWIYVHDVTLDEFSAFLRWHDAVIVKPEDGVEGDGVRKYVLSEHPDADLAQFYADWRKENAMVEQIVVQHPRMVFGNASVNTIRTHTILDSHGKAHVVKAILRAGVGSAVVDNYCQGGSVYEVDLATGLVCTCGQSKGNARSYIHPGTDIVMLGYRIPNWDQVIAECERAAERLPQVRIIGWDVAITADGIELIEGNHNPDYELLEFIGSTGYYERISNTLAL